MFNPLLKLKHWQIFLLQIGGVIIFQIIVFSSMFSLIQYGQREPEVEDVFNFMITVFSIAPLLVLYSMYFTYGWQWAIVSKFAPKLPPGVKIPIKRMKIFFIFPIIYLLGFFLVILFFMMDIAADPEAFFDQEDPPFMFIMLIALMFPFHLFTIFCVFHNFIFTAKTLKSVELQKDTKFDEYAGEFFCIWFQIIGIWILQPRINKIHAGESDFAKSNDVIDDLPTGDQEVI